MQLVERHIIVKDNNVKALCVLAKNLYNQSLYYLRQATFGNIQYFKEYELSGLFAEFNQDDYKALPAQCSQQIIKLLFKNYKSWQNARKEWMKNPSRFLGRPKLPKYKKQTSIVVFTGQQAVLKNGHIHFPAKCNLIPLKTKVDNICQVRIVPQATCFVIEVVYNKKEVLNENLDESKHLYIDLGLNNFATLMNNVGLPPTIVNGKVLKSFNQWYNKTKAVFMSYVGDVGSSNRINKLTHYRNNYIEDKLHKISRYIVDYCAEHNIATIVIGHNKSWKDSINIGKKNNQAFVSLPHSRLIHKITYKATFIGVRVIESEESYTSKVDHLALEKLGHCKTYIGKRKHRGLFQSSIGRLINADVNGCIGIGRKVFGDSVVTQILDSGWAFNPIKRNIV
jgi:putative transposase